VSWASIVTHRNDTALDEKGATHTWRIKNSGGGDGHEYQRMYRMFRLIQTGRNSNNNYYLPVSGFEIYGELGAKRSLYIFHIISYHIISFCIVLYCIVLYCIVLYCIVLYCIVLCITLHGIVLYCIVLCCI
jgi:hypothetical protein